MVRLHGEADRHYPRYGETMMIPFDYDSDDGQGL
jgi:hypothetical protein